MKAKYLILSLSIVAAVASSCYNEVENELGLLERRIESLEKACSKMQTNVSSLQTMVDALNNRDFVSRVTVNKRYDGTVEGYSIYFTKSGPITVYNGKDAETPVIGVKKADDGVYYWTVKYPSESKEEYILNNFGMKIPVEGKTPEIKIENGCWMVCYDGEVWSNLGKAVGEDGVSFIESVSDSTDYIHFEFIDKTYINFPSWSTYEKLIQSLNAASTNYSVLDSLKKALDAKLYAKDIIPIIEGTDTLGYRLCFSDGRELSFYNGVATNRPVLSAQRDTSANSDSTVLYWCVKYAGEEDFQWLTSSGNKIRANALNGTQPELSLILDAEDNIYYWGIKYSLQDEAQYLLTPTGERVRASAVENARVVDEVNVNKSVIELVVSGISYYVPRYNDFTVSFSPISNNTVVAYPGNEVVFNCIIPDGNSGYSVLPVASDGFYATVSTTDYITWAVRLKAPSSFTESSLKLIISDGEGTVKICSIKITK